ncbi:MAG: glycosyltransferase family 39 protein [Elusimicrobia bacterium]|nr:glycosyltransferase family 39 protein [Elusimicrobiota bacterium]
MAAVAKIFGANWRRVALAALAVFYCYHGHRAVVTLSPTYDEPFHITNGYVILKNADYEFGTVWAAPLAEMAAAAPLLFLPKGERPILQVAHPDYRGSRDYPFADFFFYKNRTSPERMLVLARRACWWAFLPLLIVALNYLGAALGGSVAFWSLCLFFTEPNLLAHAALANADFASAALYCLSFAAAVLAVRRPSSWAAAGLGVSLALALTVKYPNALLCFSIAVYLWLERAAIRRNSLRARHLVLALAGFVAAFCLVYRGVNVGAYWDGIKYTLTQARELGRSSFFWGRHSTEGRLAYFPALVLLKTNLPHLAAAMAGLFLLILRWRREKEPLVLAAIVVPGLHFALAMTSKVQLGLRYILPVYPFFILWAGEALSRLEKKKPALVWLCAGGIGLGALSMHRVSPWLIAYFNEAAGGPAQSHRYFTDSNNDWGQALGDLARYVRGQGVGSIYFSYFGFADPNHYGLNYIPVGFVSTVARPGNPQHSPLKESKIYLAVSATNYRATYFADRDIFRWLDAVEPEAVFGYSIFLYDLTNKPEALSRLSGLVQAAGFPDEARRLRAGR